MPAARASSPPPRAVALTLCVTAVAIVLVLGILLLGGCGKARSTGTTGDPARAVPASAPLYVGADVRPKGAKRTAALAAGRALTHQQDPYLRLLEVLHTPGSPIPDFGREVAPWLGPRAGIFLSSMRSSGAILGLVQQGLLGSSSSVPAFPFGTSGKSGAGADGAIILDTRDLAKARAFLNAAARRAGAHAATYRGIPYQTTAGGVAFGVIARFAVLGSESGLRAVIDTTAGGPSLARAPSYSALLAYAPSRGLAHVYSNAASSTTASSTTASSATASSTTTASSPAGLSGVLQRFTGARETNVSLVPAATSLALDVDSLAFGSSSTGSGLRPFISASSRALGELPGDSWLAVGLEDAGHTLATDTGALSALGSLLGAAPQGVAAPTTLNVKGLLEGFLMPLRALGASTPQARRDFQSWMGSAGLFASGSSLLELKAGAVIASTNPALSRAAVAKLAAALRTMGGSVEPASIPGTEAAVSARLNGLPVALEIAEGRSATGQSKLVIGVGEASVAAALNPPSTLAGTPAFSTAASTLGEGAQPSMIVDVPTLLGLLEGIGLAEDPTLSGALPYLRSLTTIAGGGHRLGAGVERFKVVLGLRGP